jgi:hypothetical protein
MDLINHVFRFFIAGVLLLGVSACQIDLMKFNADIPAQTLTYAGAPSISDERARFRDIFCQLMEGDSAARKKHLNCEDYLWRLSDEQKSGGHQRSIPEHDAHLRIVIITSAFAECFTETAITYEKPAARLRESGYEIDILVVGGRSSSKHNAAMIAEKVASMKLEPSDQLVLMGYSKGSTDILHFLVKYPKLAERVTAVLSVAGVINGTPIADNFAGDYNRWFAEMTLKECPPGDGGVVESLKRSEQFPWLAAHPLPPNIRYYSLAAFTTRDRIQPELLLTYDLLSAVDPRNDGQVIFYDQVIPGSELLGYVNLDHWDIAVAMRPSTGSDTDNYPLVRDILFEAMILYLAESI